MKNSIQITVYPDVTLTGVWPSEVSIDGGVTVTIYGNNFQPTGNSLLCLLGTGSTPVVAVFVSTTQITCVAPAHISGSVTLKISLNAQQYTNTGSFGYSDKVLNGKFD